MIRVLHSVSNMDRAGIETMLMNYYRHIDRDAIQFDFLCNKKKLGDYDDEIRTMGGRIFRTPGLNPVKYPKYLQYMRKLFRQYPEYRIIEAHNGAFGVYALYAAKVNHIPVRIFHAHGASITKDKKLPLKLVCKAMLPYNMNRHFTCGVAAAECYFGKKTVEAGDYELIPNAIEVERFVYDPEVRERMRALHHLTGKHVVGHVGRFTGQKNQMFLLEVFAEYAKSDDDAQLVLLGDGELLERVKERAGKIGLADRVTFVGNVPNANEWYQAFDCFVLPSIWEGLPVVGVEAQTADLPCIFSDNVTREIGFSERARFIGLNEPKDVWADALRTALHMTERRDNSRLIAEKGYDIKQEAVKLQNRYLTLAGERV